MEKEDTRKELLEALGEITEKYNLPHLAFASEIDGDYIAGIVGERVFKRDLLTVGVGVARLWQYLREQVRQYLNELEKG